MGEPLPALVLAAGMVALIAAAWLATVLLLDRPVPVVRLESAPPHEWVRGLYDDLR